MLLSCEANAQSKSDAELWSGGKMQVNLKKRFRFEGEYQYRLQENFGKKKLSFVEFGLMFKINRFLYFKPSYRIVNMPEHNDNRNRISADLYLKLKRKDFPLKFQNRLRFQRQSEISTIQKSITIRNRFGVRYELSKLVDPELSFELFYSQEQMDANRIKLGLIWNLPKRFTLNSFYALERQMSRNSNNSTHIIGVIATLDVKVKKKKIHVE